MGIIDKWASWLAKMKKSGSAAKAKDIKVRLRDEVAIRMEAIGGQGANSAGKILAESAALDCAYSAQHFSSYGSEKRGTPVRSYVRFSRVKRPLRSAAPIEHPNLLVVFHESLMKTHPEIFHGLTEDTDVLINSKSAPQDLNFPMNLKFRMIATVDATSVASKQACGLNVVMMGALLEFCPELESVKIAQKIESFFKKSEPQVLKRNAKGFELGRMGIRQKGFKEMQANVAEPELRLPALGWENAPIGGVIVNPGNSILKDHSASRKGFAPKFIKDICFNCGYCDMVCPDFCFVWKKTSSEAKTPELLGLDYQYCKACQKCVEVCPVNALVVVPESEITEQERSLKAFT